MLHVRPVEDGPWRFIVLDHFSGNAWRLPPADAAVFTPPPTIEGGKRFEIVLHSSCAGKMLPVLSDLYSVELGTSTAQLLYWPREQTLRLNIAPGEGTTYAVRVGPSREVFEVARRRKFIGTEDARPGPLARALLRLAEQESDRWSRWLVIRHAFLSATVKPGNALPQSVPPATVERVLSGEPVTAWEYVGAKALVARWALIPARLGYGYWRPDAAGVFEMRDRHVWIELLGADQVWRPMVADGIFQSY